MVGDVHMSVSIHTDSHIDTQLAVARVRDRVRVRISYRQASRVYQPRMAIHTATSEASRVYSISLCGYCTNKMSILGDRSILSTQIYNCEH